MDSEHSAVKMQSEKIGALALALALAQGEMTTASKDGENPHFNSKFATLASIWETCRGPLTKNKLAVMQGVSPSGPGAPGIFWTMLVHESGEWVRSEMPLLLTKADPQGVGSALTYYRRYCLAAMVGIVQDDDDGNAATGDGKGVEQKKAPGANRPPAGRPQGQPAKSEDRFTSAQARLNKADTVEKVVKLAERIETELGDLPNAQLESLRRLAGVRKTQLGGK